MKCRLLSPSEKQIFQFRKAGASVAALARRVQYSSRCYSILSRCMCLLMSLLRLPWFLGKWEGAEPQTIFFRHSSTAAWFAPARLWTHLPFLYILRVGMELTSSRSVSSGHSSASTCQFKEEKPKISWEHAGRSGKICHADKIALGG